MGPQPETVGGRPLWILPNPSGLNAHYKTADFARLYGEAYAAARTARATHSGAKSSRPGGGR
jgi:double-stranded uracil-DNA glycosylase